MTLAEIVAKKKLMPAVISVLPDQTLQEAIDLLCRHRIGALIVVHPVSGRIVGVCSERDVLRALCSECHRQPTATRIGEIMTSDVVIAEATQPAMGALRVMSVRHIRHLPVLERDRLIGVVTLGDVLRELHEQDEARIHSLDEYLSGTHHSSVF